MATFLFHGSMDLHETFNGQDWKESDLKDVRDRDANLVRRQGAVDWLHVQAAAAPPSQLQ